MGFPADEKFTHGIDVNFTSKTTGVFNVTNNSIENVTGDAIHMQINGPSHFHFITLNGNQIALYSNSTGKAISLASTDVGDLSDVAIVGNVFQSDGTARSAIQLTNCDNITLAANVLVDSFTSLYTNTGSTNVIEIGGGVSDHGGLTGLSDDDHTNLLNETRHDALDHGGLDGIGSSLITVDPGAVTYDDSGDDVELSIVAKWGHDGTDPYFNDAGVTAGEEAALVFDPETRDFAVVPYEE
jgi:hypothetical protein